MIGTKINRYVITEKIGEGGMGSVWRAEDPLLGRDIALKFLPESLARSPDARKRFLREAKAASTLEHPGIATVFDAGEVNEQIYIAFQLVKGETIAERVASGPLDPADACRVAFDTAEALDHAHACGVLHRDITSRNIMTDAHGRVIVVDFGLALPHGATRVTQSDTMVGTAPYLAPEVVTGKEGDERSDVYGLGVVLYEALTGMLPFDAPRTESLFYLVVHTDAEPPSAKRKGIPQELDRVVLKALAKDPDERYQSARAFAKDLHALLKTVSDHAPSARWLTEPAPTKPRGPAGAHFKRLAANPVSWVVLALVAAMVAIGVWRRDLGNGGSQAFASVAVLPFRNLSDAPGESDWLAEGLGETLTAKLTTLPRIRVSPWFTSRNFGDLSRRPRAIAKDLNVDALVMGTVRQLGERVLCTIAVVDAKTESQWWADEYKEPMDDLFEVQERIAVGVATSLKGRLSGAEQRELARPSAKSVEAYEHYIRGSTLMHAQTLESIRGAIPFFERAIELDPELADAYVGLGAVYSNIFDFESGGMRALHSAENMFRRALEFDPRSTGARRGLLRVYWEFGGSEDMLKQGREARRANPDGVENLLAAGEAYALGGLQEKSIPILERVIELDPVNEAAHYFLATALIRSARWDALIDLGEEYLYKFGEEDYVYYAVGTAHHSQGDLETAEVYYNRSLQLTGGLNYLVRLHLSTLYLDMGEDARANEIVSDGIAKAEQTLSAHADHIQVRCDMAAMCGMKGDIARLWQEFGKVKRDAASYRAQLVAAALARSGDVAAAAEVLENNVKTGFNVLGDIKQHAALFPDGFFESPEYKRAHEVMKKFHDDLSNRY